MFELFILQIIFVLLFFKLKWQNFNFIYELVRILRKNNEKFKKKILSSG